MCAISQELSTYVKLPRFTTHGSKLRQKWPHLLQVKLWLSMPDSVLILVFIGNLPLKGATERSNRHDQIPPYSTITWIIKFSVWICFKKRSYPPIQESNQKGPSRVDSIHQFRQLNQIPNPRKILEKLLEKRLLEIIEVESLTIGEVSSGKLGIAFTVDCVDFSLTTLLARPIISRGNSKDTCDAVKKRTFAKCPAARSRCAISDCTVALSGFLRM